MLSLVYAVVRANNMKPLFLNDFIGQSEAKESLQVFIQAAKGREEMLDHILLYGHPGLGKTTLANIIANEMMVDFQAVSAPAISKSADLASVLTNLRDKHILFIDEIHRLSSSVEEMLYSAMDDFKLSVIVGEGISARTMTMTIPKFTLIGATTRLSMLGSPFRERFGIHTRLEFYKESDLRTIVDHAAHALGISLETNAALSIAKRSRGTPRVALRLLRRVRDFADVAKQSHVNEEMCSSTLENLGIDSMGLDYGDRKYLNFIWTYYKDSCVGVNTIAMGINERKDTIEETIEPYLIQLGLIKKTSRGRAITARTFEALKNEPMNAIETSKP